MKNLKPVPADKKKSLGKLPTDVRNKMGYAKKGKMMSNRDKKQKEITEKQNPKSEYKKDKFGKTKLSYTEARKGKMIKAGLGKMVKKLVGSVFGKKSSTVNPTPGGQIMGEGKTPLTALYQKVTEQKTAKKSMGGEMKQGYGAARTSGMGLQDEDLIPGKSMDYYKDLM